VNEKPCCNSLLLLHIFFKKAMEDAHTTMPCVQDTDASFFAIFDGHGG
jgi:serine/threonine protein phosphatase PrpC